MRILCSGNLVKIFFVLLPGLASELGHAQTMTVLKRFNFTDGYSPCGTLVLAGNVLYGTTSSGGAANAGTVFRLNTDGSAFTTLKQFDSTGPKTPLAKLLLAGHTLYGCGLTGGSGGYGALFKIDTDGTGFGVLKNFTSADGAGPQGGLVLSGSTLYGTTYLGGTWDLGTIFKINTNGTGFVVLRSFTPYDGANPAGDLVLSGNTLYGTTHNSGGTNGMGGIVYRINVDGTGFKVLKSFSYAEGNHPYAGLALSGSTLYGGAYAGGTNGCGTLFKLNTDGTGFALLCTFNSTNGANPYATMTLAGNTLYGTTYSGGGGLSVGAVFQINTDGTGLTVLKSFMVNDPENTPTITYPYGGVVLSGTTLYGSASMGGNLGSGGIFSLTTTPSAPTITTQPQSCTNLPGTTATFQVAAIGTPPVYYQWRRNGLNLADGLGLVGTRSNLLTLTSASAASAGDYTVVVANNAGAITSSVATLTIKAAPVAVADSVDVPLALTLSIPVGALLANDFDPAGEAIYLKAVQSPSAAGVNLTVANGIITYWGAFSGTTDRFTYTITNASSLMATGSVNVALTGLLPSTNQLALAPIGNGSLRLIFAGWPTFRYSLDRTHDLVEPAVWEPLQTNWAGAQGFVIYTNTPIPGLNNFYRARRILTFP